jgi:hypothetical protein
MSDYAHRDNKVNRIGLIFILGLGFCWIGSRPVAAQAPSSEAAAKTVVSIQPARPAPSAAKALQSVAQPKPGPAEPEHTKIVRTYRGSGYFDEELADKLRPALAKTFGSPVASAPEKSASPSTVAKPGQP